MAQTPEQPVDVLSKAFFLAHLSCDNMDFEADLAQALEVLMASPDYQPRHRDPDQRDESLCKEACQGIDESEVLTPIPRELLSKNSLSGAILRHLANPETLKTIAYVHFLINQQTKTTLVQTSVEKYPEYHHRTPLCRYVCSYLGYVSKRL